MQDVVRSQGALRILGKPSFCFSFLSDEFDIYHLNDFMRGRGWRFNGQQHPNALHMCVTRPQTQPGVLDAFTEDLPAAIAYARNPPQEKPISAAMYGGLPRGVPEVQAMVRSVMVGILDSSQEVPPRPE